MKCLNERRTDLGNKQKQKKWEMDPVAEINLCQLVASINRGSETVSGPPVRQEWCRIGASPLQISLFFLLVSHSFRECDVSVCPFLPEATLGPEAQMQGDENYDTGVKKEIILVNDKKKRFPANKNKKKNMLGVKYTSEFQAMKPFIQQE